jgi:hypothetical protein
MKKHNLKVTWAKRHSRRHPVPQGRDITRPASSAAIGRTVFRSIPHLRQHCGTIAPRANLPRPNRTYRNKERCGVGGIRI